MLHTSIVRIIYKNTFAKNFTDFLLGLLYTNEPGLNQTRLVIVYYLNHLRSTPFVQTLSCLSDLSQAEKKVTCQFHCKHLHLQCT